MHTTVDYSSFLWRLDISVVSLMHTTFGNALERGFSMCLRPHQTDRCQWCPAGSFCLFVYFVLFWGGSHGGWSRIGLTVDLLLLSCLLSGAAGFCSWASFVVSHLTQSSCVSHTLPGDLKGSTHPFATGVLT